MSEGKEAIKEVKTFLHKHQPDLVMSRVPKKTKQEFIEWCDEEFCSDRGMGLKWLWDFYKGILQTGSERAEAKADEALSQIAEMRPKEEVEDKGIHLVNGKVIRIGGN